MTGLWLDEVERWQEIAADLAEAIRTGYPPYAEAALAKYQAALDAHPAQGVG